VHYQVTSKILGTGVDTLIKTNHSNEASGQYFPMVLFILLYKMVQTNESVDEILKCDHSNESY